MIKQYLKQTLTFIEKNNFNKIGNYYCNEDFVAQNGQIFKKIIKPKSIARGKMRECYRNATLLAIENKKYDYVEGYALGIIPTMHAWCVDKNNNVIDPTWSDGKEYFGVIFKREFILKQMFRQKTYGLIDNWQDNWPLFFLDKKEWKK